MLVDSLSKGTEMKWLRRHGQILLAGTVIAVLGVPIWNGHRALAADDRGWEVTILGATDEMSVQDFERIVIEAFPPGLLDPKINFMRSGAYRSDSTYRLIIVFHGDAIVDHLSLCKDTGEGGQGLVVEPHGFGGLNGSTNVTAAFCQGQASLNTADNSLSGSLHPGSASFEFLVRDVLKQLFPDGYGVLPSRRD